jgi:heptosyltransferase-2
MYTMNASIIVMPNWIGDLLLALSVVMEMPEERQLSTTLLVPEPMAGLVRMLSSTAVLPFNRKDPEKRQDALARIRSQGFRTVYLLPYSFSTAWFAMQTGIPGRRGLSLDGRRLLLTDPLPGRLRDKSRHILHEYAAILDVPYTTPESWPGVPVEADSEYRGAVVFCPGAKFGPAKKWPHFARLACLLEKDRIVVLGTDEDREAAAEIVGAAGARVTDLTGRTSLTGAAAIMAGAKAVVSNDSGLMHLAGFIGLPVVGIFGSTSQAWTRPLGKRAVVLTSTEPCAPCFKRTCRYGHYRCQSGIAPERVLQALQDGG